MAVFNRQAVVSLLTIGAGCLLFSQRVVGASDLAVEVTVLGRGAVTGEGNYASGGSVTLTAEAKPGYVFKGWSGDLSGKENPYQFEVRSPIRAFAHFEPDAGDVVYIDGIPAEAGSFVAKLRYRKASPAKAQQPGRKNHCASPKQDTYRLGQHRVGR